VWRPRAQELRSRQDQTNETNDIPQSVRAPVPPKKAPKNFQKRNANARRINLQHCQVPKSQERIAHKKPNPEEYSWALQHPQNQETSRQDLAGSQSKLDLEHCGPFPKVGRRLWP